MHGVEVHRLSQETEIAGVKHAVGAYVVRMDQPYSRMADMFLDRQYLQRQRHASVRRYRLDAGRTPQFEIDARDRYRDLEDADGARPTTTLRRKGRVEGDGAG